MTAAAKARLTKPFKAEINFQPLNGMYGCKIEEGNVSIFEVDADINECVRRAIERYLA